MDSHLLNTSLARSRARTRRAPSRFAVLVERGGRVADALLKVSICCSYVIILIVVNAGVFWRYVLDDPLIWSDTIATWAFVWMSMLAAALAIPLRAHMVADLLPGLLPKRFARWFGVLYFGSFVVVGLLLTRSGFQLVDVTGERTAPAVDLPLSWAMLAIPVAAILFCLQGARCLSRLVFERHLKGQDAIEVGL